jgi:hypothetical protein
MRLANRSIESTQMREGRSPRLREGRRVRMREGAPVREPYPPAPLDGDPPPYEPEVEPVEREAAVHAGDVTTASALNVVAGVWLIIAPWVLIYSTADPRWNDVVFGAIVTLFALVRVSGAHRTTGLSWINAAIGVWLFIAAFTIDVSSIATANDIVLGVVVFLLAIWSASASEALAGLRPRSRTGRHAARHSYRGPLTH